MSKEKTKKEYEAEIKELKDKYVKQILEYKKKVKVLELQNAELTFTKCLLEAKELGIEVK